MCKYKTRGTSRPPPLCVRVSHIRYMQTHAYERASHAWPRKKLTRCAKMHSKQVEHLIKSVEALRYYALVVVSVDRYASASWSLYFF